MPTRELTLKLVSDASQFDRGFSRAEREASNFSKTVVRAFGASAKEVDGRARALDQTFGKLAAGATGFFVAAQTVQAGFRLIGEAVDFGADAIDSFSALQESSNATAVVFGDAVRVIEEFGETSAQSVGLARSEFFELAAQVGGQLQNLGFSTSEAADQTVRLTQRASDLASVYGGTVADALGAISAALRGERDPIERYAITLSDANVSARALADGLAGTKAELDATDKAAASLALIFEQSDKVAGDFANTSDDVANRLRVASSSFEDAKAAIGEALVPALEQGLDVVPALIDAFEGLAPSIARVAESAADATPDLVGFVESLPTRAAIFGDIGRGVGGALSALQSLGEGLVNTVDAAASFGGEADQAQQAIDDFVAAFEALRGIEDDFNSIGTFNRAVLDGLEPIDAYATVLRDLAREGSIAQSVIEDLGTVSGLSTDDQLLALENLIVDADDLRLTEQAVDDLQGAYSDLAYAREQALEAEGAASFEQAEANRFGALRDLAVQAEQDAAEAAEAIATGFEEAQKAAQDAADNLAKAIEQKAGDFSSAISLFAEAPEELEQVDLGEALSNIETQIGRIERFNDALQTLADAGLQNVVADLTAQGPDAVLTAEALAGDIGTAFDLEEALKEGNETALEGAVTAVTSQRSEYQDDLIALGEFLADDVESGFANLDLTAGVLKAIDAAKGAALTASTPAATNRPGALAGFRAYGGPVAAGRSYVVGENGPELFTAPAAGRILPSGMLSGSGGSLTVTQNVHNPTTQDLGRTLDIQRQLLQASVGRMIESM